MGLAGVEQQLMINFPGQNHGEPAIRPCGQLRKNILIKSRQSRAARLDPHVFGNYNARSNPGRTNAGVPTGAKITAFGKNFALKIPIRLPAPAAKTMSQGKNDMRTMPASGDLGNACIDNTI